MRGAGARLASLRGRLLLIVLLLGAVWFFTRDPGAGAVIADGSTIEAPDEPYKTRPDDPGGREVEGTGDTSYEVAEGQQVEGQIAPGVPVPSIDRQQAAAPTATPSRRKPRRTTARDG